MGETATDTFYYTVSDGHGDNSTAKVIVTISGVNRGPAAYSDKATTDAGDAVSINVLRNDTDVNADDILRVTSLDLTGAEGAGTIGASGKITYTPGGSLDYLPVGRTAVDSFTYTVSDGHGGTSVGRVSVTVTGTWQPPVAKADGASVTSTGSTTIDVLQNDSDPQGDASLSVAAVGTDGTNGTVVINDDDTITYTPGAAYADQVPGTSAVDSFTYTVSDGHGLTSTATVSVTVDAPGGMTGTTDTTASTTAAIKGTRALYVATNGNDSWSGLLAAPNADGTDGPLATFRQAVYELSINPDITTVYIRGGDYYLTSQISLDSSNSGESWLAYPGETPVLHGGPKVTGWTHGANGIWTAQAPSGAFPSGFAGGDLFVSGTREIHSRYPNYDPHDPVEGGWLFAAAPVAGENTLRSFQFDAGDVPRFSSTAGLYVDVYQANGWQNVILPISAINYTTHTITMSGNAPMAIGSGSRYFIFNAADQVDSSNEWYYDSTSNTISLYAPSGFTGAHASVGTLGKIFSLSGANNVTIAGLTITDTAGNSSGISVQNSTGVDITGNRIGNTGIGVLVGGTSSNTTIEGNEISNTNGHGVQLNTGSSGTDVLGNYIHNVGQLTSGAGVWFIGSSDNVISNNLIKYTAGAGVGGGSTVNHPAGSYNNMISYNQIGFANQSRSDGGGVDIGGTQEDLTGDTIEYNRIYDTTAAGTDSSGNFVDPTQLVSFGIYLDDFTSGVKVRGNILFDNIGGIDVHAGWNNTIYDNILADNTGIAMKVSPLSLLGVGAFPASNNLFTNNVVSDTSAGAIVAKNLGDPIAGTWKSNFYDSSGLGSASFYSNTAGDYLASNLSTWEALGYDAGTRSGDPDFVDPANNNFTLSSGSAALAMGILNPPVSQIGLAAFQKTNSYDLYGS